MTMELVRPAATQRRCALYRHFDEADVLLYVGITETLGDRTNSGHARSSDWVQFAVRAEAEWHDSRELAAQAEREAVREERPIFNRQYAEGNVDLQILSYLHERKLQLIRATLDLYRSAAAELLAALPDSHRSDAEKWVAEDYQMAGLERDDRFDAWMLRRVAGDISAWSTETRYDATAHALCDVMEFVGKKLEALRDQRQAEAEPPF